MKRDDSGCITVERREDMSPLGRLCLIQQADGDVLVVIRPDPNARSWERQSVEFCSVGAGGGRSPRTLAALRELMKAMDEDNREQPID